MNLTLNSSSGFLSVGELRAFLAEHEKHWTEEDTIYLGKFEDQSILCLPPESGYTSSKIIQGFGYGGFMIIPTNQQGEAINE